MAIYTYNHPAYMEGVYAAIKAALVPVNVNYRYREEELRYLLDNADAEIAIVHEEFAAADRRLRRDLPRLRGVLVVGDATRSRRPPAAATPTTTRRWPRPTAPAPAVRAQRPTTCCSSTPAAPPACRRA